MKLVCEKIEVPFKNTEKKIKTLMGNLTENINKKFTKTSLMVWFGLFGFMAYQPL